MSEQQLQVWVRNDKGQVYGPLSPPSIELLIDNSVIAGRMQISTDGINYVYPGRVPGLRMIFPKATWGDTVIPGDELDAQWSQVVMPAAIPAGASPAAAPAAGAVPGPPVMSSASGIRPGPPPGAMAGAMPGGPVAGPGARGQPGRPMVPGQVQGNRPAAVARPASVGDFINNPTAPGSAVRSSPSTIAPAGAVKSSPSVADFLNAAVTGGPGAPPAKNLAVNPAVNPGVNPGVKAAAPAAAAPQKSATSSTGSGLRAAPPTGDVQIPASGSLGETSVQQLYYLAAVSEVTGLLTLKVSDREFVAHFRKGNPEYLDSTHHEDSLETFLLAQKLATQAQLDQAQAQASRFGGELLGALFGLGLLNPNAVFQHLGQRAGSLLHKILSAEQGTFTFDHEDFPAAKSLPLGNKWAVYLEALRKVPISDVRRRLSRALELPVMKATGRAAVTELRLTPQETRAHNHFDGVRSLSQLVSDLPGEGDHILRTAWMLNPLELVSFAGVSVSAQKASAPPPPKPAAAPAPAPAKPAGPPGGAIPGGPPKISAPGAAPQQQKPAGPAGSTVPGPPPAVAAAARPASAPGNPVQMPKAGMPYPGGPQPVAAPPPPAAPPAAAAPPQRPPPPVMKPAAPVVTAARGQATPVPAIAPADAKQLQAQYEQMKKQNYFEVLGLKRDADANAVKIAYLKAARSYHPDTVAPGSPEALAKAKADIFALIGEANRTLSDAVLRADYVAELDAGGTGSKVDVEKILRAEEVFQKGRIMMQNRKYAEGLKLFEEAVTCNEDEAEFYAWRGYAKYLSATDRKASGTVAMKDLQHCISKNPNVATAYYFMGFIQKANGDEKNALANFKKTVALDPKHIDAQREVRSSKK